MRLKKRHLDLQAKIIIVLIAVVVPTFLIVTIAENKVTQPILSEEMKQIGITSAKTLASEIASHRLLSLPNAASTIESKIQEFLYSQPNILRVDVIIRDHNGEAKLLASNIEEEGQPADYHFAFDDKIVSEYKKDETDTWTWDIGVPIEQRARDKKSGKRILGVVHVVVSMKFVNHTVNAIWKITGTAAVFTVILLILALSYFLRKTIANDRLLRQTEDQNLQLTNQLHDMQRKLMNTEKLAVMGQLTASFAHEIGTPLSAIGGHLQLLREELPDKRSNERIDIINSQLARIEQIVKNFLQSTIKPPSQRQLVDVNRLIDQTLALVKPRIETAGIEVKKEFDREMGPLRMVPLDLEQILLNLVNNSLDSLKNKSQVRSYDFRVRKQLEVSTRVSQIEGNAWAYIMVYDTGEGIKKGHLSNVLKPFFTTKAPGDGTGLGLTICQQLAKKYGGMLEIESKEGAWTKVSLKIPYQVTV